MRAASQPSTAVSRARIRHAVSAPTPKSAIRPAAPNIPAPTPAVLPFWVSSARASSISWRMSWVVWLDSSLVRSAIDRSWVEPGGVVAMASSSSYSGHGLGRNGRGLVARRERVRRHRAVRLGELAAHGARGDRAGSGGGDHGECDFARPVALGPAARLDRLQRVTGRLGAVLHPLLDLLVLRGLGRAAPLSGALVGGEHVVGRLHEALLYVLVVRQAVEVDAGLGGSVLGHLSCPSVDACSREACPVGRGTNAPCPYPVGG